MSTAVSQMTTTVSNLSSSVSQLTSDVTSLDSRLDSLERDFKITKLEEFSISESYVNSSDTNWFVERESGNTYYYTVFEVGSKLSWVLLTTVGTRRTRYLTSDTPLSDVKATLNAGTGYIYGTSSAACSDNVSKLSINTHGSKYLYVYEGSTNGTVTLE